MSVDQGIQRPLDSPRSRIAERRGNARGEVGAGDEAEVAEHARHGRVQSFQNFTSRLTDGTAGPTNFSKARALSA